MNLNEIHYGIEIETVKRTREQIAWAIHSVVAARFAISGFRAATTPGRSRTCAAALGRWWGTPP